MNEGQQTYNLDVDWKLLAENFMEWYHVGPVHPELAKFSTMDKHHMNEGYGNYIGFVTAPVTNCGGPADTDLFNPTPNTTEKDQTTAYFYHIFPNVSVTVYPHSVYTLIMLPEAPGKSKETLYLLQHPDCRLETDTDEEYNTKADNLMKFVTNVNDEDIYIVNRVSKGLRNTHYRGGRFAPDGTNMLPVPKHARRCNDSKTSHISFRGPGLQRTNPETNPGETERTGREAGQIYSSELCWCRKYRGNRS